MIESARRVLAYSSYISRARSVGAVALASVAMFIGGAGANAEPTTAANDVVTVIEEIVDDACIPFIEGERSMIWWFRSSRLGEARRGFVQGQTEFDVPDAPIHLNLSIVESGTVCSFQSPIERGWSDQDVAELFSYADSLAANWVGEARVRVDLSGQGFERFILYRLRPKESRFVLVADSPMGLGDGTGTMLLVGADEFGEELPDA